MRDEQDREGIAHKVNVNVSRVSSGVSGLANITGTITKCDFEELLAPGANIDIQVDGNLTDLTRSPTAHWNGAFTAEGNGIKDCTEFDGSGTVIGPDLPKELHLGTMPDHDVSIEVKLWGNPAFFAACPPGF